jgi:hypothetical protein
VHLYTLRNEPLTWSGNFASIDAEYNYYFKTLGVEGGFTDFPGTLAAWTRAKGTWSFPGNRWLQALTHRTPNGLRLPCRAGSCHNCNPTMCNPAAVPHQWHTCMALCVWLHTHWQLGGGGLC